MGPLNSIRVVELANVIAGPTACQILGDFGAEIIKIEHPQGDGIRRQGPTKDGIPLWWKVIGRNKRSVGMYLGHPEVAEMLLELVATADVVVESFRPGTIERWNIGPERMRERNPDLIIARLSGFGQEGPYAHRPAFGTLIESMSGFAHMTGQPDGPPTLPPLALADYFAGLAAVSAIMMALYNRDAGNGGGQVIDLSIMEPLLSTMGAQIIRHDQLGLVESRTGNRSVNTAPRNTYLTKDGHWVGVSSSTNETAARIVAMCGRPELAAEDWFSSGLGRVQNNDLLDEVVGTWMADRTLEDVMREVEKWQTTVAPVYNVPQLLADPQVRDREMVTTVADGSLGPIRMPNVMFRFSETPGSIRWPGEELGGSTDAVLVSELGVDPTKLERLRQDGVVI